MDELNISLISQVDELLPSASGKKIHYSSSKGGFISDGWTSSAGNTYAQFFYLSPKIAVVCDFGVGYAHTFINGIKIFRHNGSRSELINSRYYHCCFFNELFIQNECIDMISQFIKCNIRIMGVCANDNEINIMSRQLMREAVNYPRTLK